MSDRNPELIQIPRSPRDSDAISDSQTVFEAEGKISPPQQNATLSSQPPEVLDLISKFATRNSTSTWVALLNTSKALMHATLRHHVTFTLDTKADYRQFSMVAQRISKIAATSQSSEAEDGDSSRPERWRPTMEINLSTLPGGVPWFEKISKYIEAFQNTAACRDLTLSLVTRTEDLFCVYDSLGKVQNLEHIPTIYHTFASSILRCQVNTLRGSYKGSFLVEVQAFGRAMNKVIEQTGKSLNTLDLRLPHVLHPSIPLHPIRADNIDLHLTVRSVESNKERLLDLIQNTSGIRRWRIHQLHEIPPSNMANADEAFAEFFAELTRRCATLHEATRRPSSVEEVSFHPLEKAGEPRSSDS